MKQEGLKIRAHHGMCLHFFEGKGYSNEFRNAEKSRGRGGCLWG